MSYWDSSALVKLYVQELDSAEFREVAVKASRAVDIVIQPETGSDGTGIWRGA